MSKAMYQLHKKKYVIALRKNNFRPIKIERDLADNLVQIPAQNKASFKLRSDSS